MHILKPSAAYPGSGGFGISNEGISLVYTRSHISMLIHLLRASLDIQHCPHTQLLILTPVTVAELARTAPADSMAKGEAIFLLHQTS